MTYIGMDIHQKTSTMAWRHPASGELYSAKFFTKPDDILAALQELPRPWTIAVEATREAPWVCRLLLANEAEVHLAHPSKLSVLAKLRPAKTDLKDAILLLELLEQGLLPEAYLAPEEVQQRRAISRNREVIRSLATKLRNVIRSILCHAGIQVERTDLCGKEAREMVPDLLAELPGRDRLMANIMWRQLLEVEGDIACIDELIKDTVSKDEVAQALCILPGIGPVLAYSLMAEIGEIQRFSSCKQLHAYAGCVPRVSQSGEHCHHGKLWPRCNKRLRTYAVLAAQNAIRAKAHSKAKEAFRRASRKHHYNTAKIAAARKILTDVFHIWHELTH